VTGYIRVVAKWASRTARNVTAKAFVVSSVDVFVEVRPSFGGVRAVLVRAMKQGLGSERWGGSLAGDGSSCGRRCG
jgi:hypothetical protein